ncbi:lytic murein transglycosylase [Mesorhizobium loti]|uniref:Lytic murein transglycosylase n=1 Tax=Mesorhizobium jarvisii TaxID=1777867 RepID=A0A6M7TAL9_9HYPH|nr:lytic murein transglycosylase [Mesorhizobium jarvisii]QKD07166.1 lytic murein transglycosylase [Mesorhizobium loti]RJT31510.1 lytic murein transglycosylase [Mesorhizobium jarvisii]
MTARSTPLCPAGHLPRKGGDRMLSLLSPMTSAARKAPRSKLLISPLAGEMSGRTEGGDWARPLQSACPA